MPELLVPVVALVVGFAMVVGIAKWSLGPMNRAAGVLKAPTRFRLSDFVWLILQIQIVLAGCAQTIDLNDTLGLGLALSLLLGATAAMWVGAVSCVSKAGVVNPWRRGVFILFQLPLTLTCMFAIPICLGSALFATLQFLASQSQDIPTGSVLPIAIRFAISLILAGACGGIRFVSYWVLQGSAWANAQVLEVTHRNTDERRVEDNFAA